MVLFVIMEIVLVIIATTGMFALVNRASTNYTPEKNYAARDLALTHDALETVTNTYYDFSSPAMMPLFVSPSKDIHTTPPLMGFTETTAKVGGFEAPLLRNMLLSYAPIVEDVARFGAIQMQIAARTFSNGLIVRKAIADQQFINYAVPCAAVSFHPQTIALIPVTEASVAFANLIASTDKRFIPSTEERKALITDNGLALASSAKADLTVYVFVADTPGIKVYGSKDGYLGCTIVNAVLGMQKVDAAYVPSFEDKPLLTIGIHAALTIPANADAIRKVLS